MLIASFDIGKKNFAFTVADIDLDKLKKIKNIPKKDRYNVDGTCTKEFASILHKIYKSGDVLLLSNNDLTGDTNKKLYLDPKIYHNLIELMKKYESLWDKVDIFLLELQMSFKGKINTMALKICQTVYTYLLMTYGRFKIYIEFKAFYKGQVLGMNKLEHKNKKGVVKYKSLPKIDQKKWSVKMAAEILRIQDNIYLPELIKKGKKDDKADVICQLYSFVYLYFIEKMKFDS